MEFESLLQGFKLIPSARRITNNYHHPNMLNGITPMSRNQSIIKPNVQITHTEPSNVSLRPICSSRKPSVETRKFRILNHNHITQRVLTLGKHNHGPRF